MRDTFARTFYELAQADPSYFIVVADISPGAGLAKLAQEFPDRFLNVGVSEQAMIGLCAGLAMRGCRPFAYTIATFTIYRPFEMIRDDLCYQNLPVVLVGVGGGVTYSNLGGTHHAQEDIAVMSSLPNMSIVAPCDPLETRDATLACARSSGPVYLRLGKAGEPNFTADAVDPFVMGKLRYIRHGADVCILTYGPIMGIALEVAAGLEAQGLGVSVVSAHTLKPLDHAGIAAALSNHDQMLVIEEHSIQNGLGAQVKQIAWDVQARCDLQTFGLRDEFIHVYGTHRELLRAHGLDPELILRAVAPARAGLRNR